MASPSTSEQTTPGFRGGALTIAVSALITIVGLLWVGGATRWLGIALYFEQYLLSTLTLVLVSTYLRVGWRGRARLGGASGIGSADWALATLSLLAGAYLVWRYPVLLNDWFFRPAESITLGAVYALLVIEALRRSSGWALIIVLLVVIAYTLLANLMPGPLEGRAMSPNRIVTFVAYDANAMVGVPLAIAATVVVVFVFLGRLLLASGGADFFTDLAKALTGRSRGGSAKISIVASAFFGSISGNAVSNVASTGVITIPMMHRSGIKPRSAAAIESVASTGGQMMPPVMGAAAFLIAEFLGISYGTVILAAAIPALLYFFALFLQADFLAARLNLPPLAPEEIPRLGPVLAQGWHFITPFVVLFVALFVFNQPDETAALYAALSLVLVCLLFSYGGKRLTLTSLGSSIFRAGMAVGDIVLICAVAGMIVGLLQFTGLSFNLGQLLRSVGEISLTLLLVVTGAISIVLGMGMPTTSVYILLATIGAPPLIELGAPALSAHFFVFYFGMLSMITPPVALAAFTAANLAGAPAMATAVTAMRLAWPAYVVPFLFVYAPTLLMQGSAAAVGLAVVTALIGVWLISAAFEGILVGRLATWQRPIVGIVGLMLLIPAGAFEGAIWIELVGLAGAAVIAGRALMIVRMRRA